MTFRTTFRETRKSRQIALIVIFREKYARRILAIVSTISISNSASQTTRRPVWTLIPGVPIGCRSPRKRGPYSMPNDTLPGNTGGDFGLREPVHEATTDSRTGEDEGGDSFVHASPCHRPGMDARGVPADAQGWSIWHRRCDGGAVRGEP